MFSDQGAWFAYGFPNDAEYYGGFSGPFLMTQGNGAWSSKVLSQLNLSNVENNNLIDWSNFKVSQTSYNSHLEQVFENENLKISQKLFFISAHSAMIITQISNLSNQIIKLKPSWSGTAFLKGLQVKKEDDNVLITSLESTAKGLIQIFGDKIIKLAVNDSSYFMGINSFNLKQGETKQMILVQSFIFPEYNTENELKHITTVAHEPFKYLQLRKNEKEKQLENVYAKLDTYWKNNIYKDLLAKTILTLQNNWRISAGKLKHSGLFPSYHYIWFNGFWAWDSWKHAVAIAQYDVPLAKEQIKAMYDYQTNDGFIPDCIYRDTTIEQNNYRNTKPPLSAWAVWKVYQQCLDINFLSEMYPKIVKQHNWWYINRDHDNDGICEYGSTDGSLIAAKWESGMDNAVRFDNSTILENSETAYSLNQESVDLNAYLFAEKKYLIEMANVLNKKEDVEMLEKQAEILKKKIQNQFFDEKTGWFYDTSIDGDEFIREMGCEGWIPLWAEIATKKQAEKVKNNMMNTTLFNTKVPFQTLSASNQKFKPEGGYWRGPNWIDQSYFGVKALHNYGYHDEAYKASYKLMHNAEGVLIKGKSIRENYQAITGKGLESENFSWSAAHYLLLLINE